MDRRELNMLASAVCNDSLCAIARRGYGKLWGEDYTTMKGLEARGLLRFSSCHREPSSGEFIRRSELTEEGRTALRSECAAVA